MDAHWKHVTDRFDTGDEKPGPHAEAVLRLIDDLDEVQGASDARPNKGGWLLVTDRALYVGEQRALGMGGTKRVTRIRLSDISKVNFGQRGLTEYVLTLHDNQIALASVLRDGVSSDPVAVANAIERGRRSGQQSGAIEESSELKKLRSLPLDHPRFNPQKPGRTPWSNPSLTPKEASNFIGSCDEFEWSGDVIDNIGGEDRTCLHCQRIERVHWSLPPERHRYFQERFLLWASEVGHRVEEPCTEFSDSGETLNSPPDSVCANCRGIENRHENLSPERMKFFEDRQMSGLLMLARTHRDDGRDLVDFQRMILEEAGEPTTPQA